MKILMVIAVAAGILSLSACASTFERMAGSYVAPRASLDAPLERAAGAGGSGGGAASSRR